MAIPANQSASEIYGSENSDNHCQLNQNTVNQEIKLYSF